MTSNQPGLVLVVDIVNFNEDFGVGQIVPQYREVPAPLTRGQVRPVQD